MLINRLCVFCELNKVTIDIIVLIIFYSMKTGSIYSDEEKLAEKCEELIKPMLKTNIAHMFYLVENPGWDWFYE